jgi:predicted transposase YdaD
LKHDKEFVEAFDILEKMAHSDVDLFSYLAAADAEGREKRIEKNALRRGQETGERKKAEEMVLKLLKKEKEIDEISDLTGLSVEEIKELQKKMK